MIRAILVVAWYTCALPTPEKQCVEIETKAYSSIIDAVQGYLKADNALDRHLYFVGEGVTSVRQYDQYPSSLPVTGRVIPQDPTSAKPLEDDFDYGFAMMSEKVAAEVDAKLCIRALYARDQFGVKLYCSLDCNAMRNVSSDLDITERVRDFIFENVKKCRLAAQDRAFNRLVCGKDECSPPYSGDGSKITVAPGIRLTLEGTK